MRKQVLSGQDKECRNLLETFYSRDAHTCADIKSLSDDKRQDLEEQMQNLKMVNTTLNLIFAAC
jgi:hypothetical protein